MLILWGLMKKAVIADRIAPAVDMVYASPSDYSSFECWLATMLFMVQIYCDFSGYTDMAIGSARIFGVNLMKNFHRPWLASSLSEFWNRWHISLSSWFYDYVYSPVASFSFMHPSLWYAALLLTFLCSGFWHGASFTFIAWGAYNGFCLILESQVISPRRFKRSVWGILVTQFLMIISWVLFRAQTIPQALEIYYRMFIPENFTISSLGLSAFDWIVAMLFLCLMIFAESYYEEGWMIGTRSAFGSLFFGAIFVMVIWVFGVFGGSQFLYFQF
jgi:D-alanyl-lipoteichoic acid acyltransferase DltB (MBOAT superfamily)